MKLFGAIVGLVAAQYNPTDAPTAAPTDAPTAAPTTTQAPAEPNWPGNGDLEIVGNLCGSQAAVDANSWNATCVISLNGYKSKFISVAGSFPLPMDSGMTFTGFEGLTPENTLDVVVFWEQDYLADGKTPDNSTCGADTDISISCEDYGGEWTTPNLVNNFVHDPRQTSFSVGVKNGNADFSIDLTKYGTITNATSGHGEVANTGAAYTVAFGSNNGVLDYFHFNGAAGNSQYSQGN